jgi:hypothetical protein
VVAQGAGGLLRERLEHVAARWSYRSRERFARPLLGTRGRTSSIGAGSQPCTSRNSRIASPAIRQSSCCRRRSCCCPVGRGFCYPWFLRRRRVHTTLQPSGNPVSVVPACALLIEIASPCERAHLHWLIVRVPTPILLVIPGGKRQARRLTTGDARTIVIVDPWNTPAVTVPTRVRTIWPATVCDDDTYV